MKNAKVLTILFVIFLNSAVFAQLKITKVFSATDVNLFEASLYEAAITRQNSASINLKEFLFPEVRDGNYIVALNVALLQYPINSTKPIEKGQIAVLFDDVRKEIKSNEPMELSLKDKVLGFNFILSDVTHVKIEVRMVKVKSEYEPLLELVKPILNIAMKDASSIQLIDNILRSMGTEDNKNNLLFQTELYVPNNVFEFNSIKNKTEIPLVKNNADLAIVLEGTTPINDESLLGKGKDLINKVTTFVVGKKTIPKDKVKYSGLVTININKEQIPVLPSHVEEDLTDFNRIINGVEPINEQEALNSLLRSIPRATAISLKNKEINKQADFSINEYMKLAIVYINMLKGNEKKEGENNPDWIRQFKTWCTNIETRGTAFGVEAIGINDVYPDKTAKIYIPYSLNDELLKSLYLWQVTLHTKLSENSDKSMAISKMAIPAN